MGKALLHIGIWSLCCWLVACADEHRMDNGQEVPPSQAVVQIAAGDHIDSAQVFFLRKTAVSDSLVFRQMIYDVGTTPVRFDFNLPAGSYTMYVFGNLPTDRLMLEPPYASANIGYSYQGGVQPPVVYYGYNNLNVGTDTLKFSGLILLVSEVILTIREVPAGISRIEVNFLNTSSGTGLDGYFAEAMAPPLHETVDGVKEGGSYAVSTYCFPPRGNEKSSVEVLCYSDLGKLVYHGESVPFLLKSGHRMAMACSFALVAQNLRRQGVSEGRPLDDAILRWEYVETPL